MLRRYVPSVSLHHVPGGGVPLVGSNHRAGARAATEHLIRLGHTTIGTVTGPFRRHVVRSQAARLRRRAACRGHRAGRGPGRRGRLDAGYRGRRHPAAAGAGPGDDRHLRAQRHHGHRRAQRAGRGRPPGAADVAVVGCDDMPFAEYLMPPLSSLRVPFAETGEQAVELLLHSIAGETAPEAPVRLPVELIVRESCGAAQPSPAASRAPRKPQPTRRTRDPDRGGSCPPARHRGPQRLRRLRRAPRPLHLRRPVRRGLSASRRPRVPQGRPGPAPRAPAVRPALARRQLRVQLPLDRRHRARRTAGRAAPSWPGAARSPTGSAPTSSWPTAPSSAPSRTSA